VTGKLPAPWRLLLSEQLDNLLGRNRSLPQQAPGTIIAGEIDNSGRHIARRLTAVDYEWKAIAQLITDFLRVGALDSAVQIG
jgi:hypothetical protein